VAVVGDGALTGGMCWEALNNIAASSLPVVIVVNDNGRSYSPTIGGLADHLATLRMTQGYERAPRHGEDDAGRRRRSSALRSTPRCTASSAASRTSCSRRCSSRTSA
jgi:1-deoxy-D-xylulose-5-phosphate synthase